MTPDVCAGHAAGRHCDQWPCCFVPASRLEACADEVDGALATGELPDPDGGFAELVAELRAAVRCDARTTAAEPCWPDGKVPDFGEPA